MAYEVLIVNDITSKYYGTIKAALRKKGRPIPENDIWISALALQHNLTLATRDKHFDEVDGLLTEKWEVDFFEMTSHPSTLNTSSGDLFNIPLLLANPVTTVSKQTSTNKISTGITWG